MLQTHEASILVMVSNKIHIRDQDVSCLVRKFSTIHLNVNIKRHAWHSHQSDCCASAGITCAQPFVMGSHDTASPLPLHLY
ncbi:hypothetical protein BDV36DRAFT_257147 [Aspergillus pseudocaelatus]|uniref:Hydrophobin n=1 Tax=Aspergillus pseudocaelatus TaxID=1825620 RepID=A0ABQ6WJT3_9EURO|nr:hypothetical protein BDV36DRAFT_257147 [Aspergillus pseudocaelatus]